MPLTRKEFDRLRQESPPRLLDLEWEDSESFEIPWEDVATALAWARAQVADGLLLTVTCAQGKSRSGTMATAYLMAKMKLPAAEALALVRARRPLVEPNPGFLRQLKAFEAALHLQSAPMSGREARLRAAFATYDADNSGGLSVKELRVALVQSGASANAAQPMVDEFAANGTELTRDEFVCAWAARGCGPISGA